MTAGTRESLIHLLMMAEIGLPLTLVLLCEVNPLVLTTISASIAAHEATALGDVSTAEHSGREVTTFEQHVHGFLESMPIMAASPLTDFVGEMQRRGPADRIIKLERGDSATV